MHPHRMTTIEVTSPTGDHNNMMTATDSETESLVVHAHGDCNVDDFLSENECETDIEIDEGIVKPQYLNNNTSCNNPEAAAVEEEATRAKTRLLSRSHSASDLSTQPDTLSVSSLPIEPPRRNSSGEYPGGLDDGPQLKPLASLQDIELPKPKIHHLQRSNLSPTSTMHYTPQTGWKNQNIVHQDKEDDFTVLLQTTAERVLNKLKSRQQDLRCDLGTGQKYQRRPSHGLQPPVPRKLQPILRDGNKTPRSECDMRSVNSDADLGPLSAA
ncbi:hypothetical protein JTE90_018554 [Oedothorax gibbosus]|uniref:Uncharacterized protein n=1 Tax=Oedothorax gibbosus TaxID=931172 RepID=A0AAV6U3B0_9ARAC|nr:hypothetical protein JTE90_018554 [Oedothorax gibbosus]